jgi:hypothetical protein
VNRCWSLLGNSGRSNENVNLAKLQDGRIHGILNTLVIPNVDLVEDDGDAILGRELGDSVVSMLLEDVEDSESLEVNIAESIRNAVSEASSTT